MHVASDHAAEQSAANTVYPVVETEPDEQHAQHVLVLQLVGQPLPVQPVAACDPQLLWPYELPTILSCSLNAFLNVRVVWSPFHRQ
jgi:hypothetical protein